MPNRFNTFMEGDVETGAARVAHAVVFGLMGAAFHVVITFVLAFVFGWDEPVWVGFHVPGWVNLALFGVFVSITETSRHRFWQLERRRPTRTERAVMGFRCSAGFIVFGFVGVFWLLGYDGSWPFLVFLAAAFTVFWTTMEARFSDRAWRRIEKQAMENGIHPPPSGVDVPHMPALTSTSAAQTGAYRIDRDR